MKVIKCFHGQVQGIIRMVIDYETVAVILTLIYKIRNKTETFLHLLAPVS